MDFISMLQDGSGLIAWLTAALLALGGTAVVVAVWTQIRRGVPLMTVLKAALGLQRRPVAAKAGAAPTAPPQSIEEKPRRAESAPQAIRAYRSESSMTTPEHELEGRSAAPAAPSAEPAPRPVLSERQLTVYLNRLRRAADILEEVAHRESQPAGSAEEGTLLATH